MEQKRFGYLVRVKENVTRKVYDKCQQCKEEQTEDSGRHGVETCGKWKVTTKSRSWKRTEDYFLKYYPDVLRCLQLIFITM